MTSGEALLNRLDPVLAAWLGHLEANQVQMAPLAGLKSELSGWLKLLATDDLADRDTLMRQVAFHARNLGAEGRPASAAVMQALLLEDGLRAAGVDPSPWAPRIREMVRVVADAHALGASVRLQRSFHERLVRAPLVRIPGRAMVAFLVGGMQAELIDSVLGRLLRAGAGSDEPLTILDVSGAPDDDQTFHRSLHGFATRPDFRGLTLQVCGLRDPEATQRALDQLSTPKDRVVLHARLEDVWAPNSQSLTLRRDP